MSHATETADEEDAFILGDYDSDQDMAKQSKPHNTGDNGLSIETQELMAKLGMSLDSSVSEDKVEDDDELKIYYCSRTHSQLTQFANELRRVHLPSSVPPETLNQTHDQVDCIGTEESVKQITLGSRKNLCINSKVMRLNNANAINERCLELQDAKTSAEHRCPHLPRKDNESLVNDFRDYALAKIRDIEDLGELGKKLGVCPYYASRAAVKPSEIVTLPYPLLLQKSSREALGISLKDHVVIIDEAHNLMDAIASIYSTTVTLAQLKLAHRQLMQYLQKFRNRLKGKNRVYVAQAVRLLDSIIGYLGQLPAKHTADEYGVNASDLTAGKGVDQINLHKLSHYLQESKLARKVDGYTKHITTQGRGDGLLTGTQDTTPVLMQVQSFLLTLMNPSAEGRFFVSTNIWEGDMQLRYMLLDPTNHFRDIVDEARSVILAGGTMSPMTDYTQFLFNYLNPARLQTLSCGHVIPAANLLALPVTAALSGTEFDFTFEKRMQTARIDDLGRTILSFIRIIPDGVVIFFPSYAYLDHCVKAWRNTVPGAGNVSIWQQFLAVKPVFKESQSKPADSGTSPQVNLSSQQSSSDTLLTSYSSAITSGNGRGALLFAVINGTLSEGINFSDTLGRGVAVVGMPFPNPHSMEWKSKMDLVAQTRGKEAARDFYTNACMRSVNQAVGRAIRHKGDYAAILLLDKRYGTKNVQDKLPGWIRSSLRAGTGTSQAGNEVRRFFDSKASM